MIQLTECSDPGSLFVKARIVNEKNVLTLKMTIHVIYFFLVSSIHLIKMQQVQSKSDIVKGSCPVKFNDM